MSIKLGSTNINLPYSKAYLGSNLVYQKSGGYEDVEFTSCPFPTSWTVVTTGTKYKSTNSYGEWIINAEGYKSNSVNNAFDNDTSSYWESNELSSNKESSSISIELPNGVLIKPTSIHFIYKYMSSCVIYGHNPETDKWETVQTVSTSSNVAIQECTFDIINNIFYDKFKISGTRMNALFTSLNVFEFQITSGTLRKEN